MSSQAAGRSAQGKRPARIHFALELTRSLAVRASAAQQRLISTVAGSDYTANIFLVGMRLQR